MSFHIALYTASLAAGPLQMAALGDVVVAPAASGYLVPPTINKIARVVGVGNLMVRGQLNSASLRDYTPFDVSPVNVGTIMNNPVCELDLHDSPIPLAVNEELDVFAVNSGAGPTQTSMAVVFSDGPLLPVKGRMFTVHWTSAVALSAGLIWAAVTPTLDNGLPSGTFAIVGSRQKSATALFHRFVPRGGAPYRPGTTSQQDDKGGQNRNDRYGALGEWMRFTNTTMPAMEVFAAAADATQSGYIDLIQVA